MHRTRNLIVIAAALALVVAIALVANGGRKNAVSVKLVTLKYGNFQAKLPETGTIMHPGTQTIPALVAGNIGTISARSGDRVAAGQVLATVNNPSLESTAAGSQADFQSAVANIADARTNQENARVQYEANVATQKSLYDETRRVYLADVALYAQKAIPKNNVDADRAKLEQARVAYEQAVNQLRLGAVSGYGQNSVKYAVANADKARIINQQDQQQLSFTRITAPFSGIIQTVATPADPLRPIQPGDAVTAGQTIFTIASDNGFVVKAQVDEQDIINVVPGQRATITGEDFPGRTLRGHVASIAPVAVKSTDATSTAKQVLTTIALDESPSFLKDGMSVDVDIVTTNVARAIAVPVAAVTKDRGTAYVYVVRHGRAVKTKVKLGASNDSQTVVRSGLAPGDVIVAEKNPDVVDGAAVTPAPSASPQPANS